MSAIISSSQVSHLSIFPPCFEAFPRIVMPSRHLVPRIRLELLDSSQSSLSLSNTPDIRESQVKLFPKLLAEHPVFDDADDTLYLDDGYLQDVPSFPTGRRPPLFILNSHRTRLPFPIRSDAIEWGDFFWDEEDVRPLLTIPTIPRMKLMIKEQLYVQKWVDDLASDNPSPPKHVPWTYDRPSVRKRKWTPEGTIFPAAVIKSEVPLPGESGTSSEASTAIQSSVVSHPPTSHAFVGSVDIDSRILGQGSSTSSSRLRTLRASSSSTSGPQSVTAPNTSPSHAPLATRRGKSLNGLKLNRSVIEQLEYPDIPTAFRGSSSGWPSQFNVFLTPSFTDHESMLLDLRSKCAALGNGMSTSASELPCPKPKMTRTSPSTDEWAFIQALATFDNVPGPTDSQDSRKVAVDVDVLPSGSSTPANGPSVACSTPAQSPVNRCSDPPRVPLPPRPALVNPSTPPHVRGILKKIKSVRFEDVTAKETNLLSSLECLPPVLAVSSERPCTPMPNPSRSSAGRAPYGQEVPVHIRKTQEKKPSPRSRLALKTNGKLGPVQPTIGNQEARPTLATNMIERPCRIAHLKEKTNSVTAHQTQARHKVSSISGTDLRRGIEGPIAKNRLSTPLRNIFRFR